MSVLNNIKNVSYADKLIKKVSEITSLPLGKNGRGKYFNSSDMVTNLMNFFLNKNFKIFEESINNSLSLYPQWVQDEFKYAFMDMMMVGYFCWIADSMLNGRNLMNIKDFSPTDLENSWKDTFTAKFNTILSNQIFYAVFERNADYFVKQTTARYSPLKNFPKNNIENFKKSLIIQGAFGYIAALSEAKFRN